MSAVVTIEELIPEPGKPVGRELIMEVMPHRDPFLWLTRIVEHQVGERVVAELDVDPDLEIFEGHFPGHPVLPGVIIMEALAQAAGFIVLANPENAGKVGFLANIDKAKFRRQVLPGDTLTLEATITKQNSRSARAVVTASVNGEVAATAEQFYVMAKTEE